MVVFIVFITAIQASKDIRRNDFDFNFESRSFVVFDEFIWQKQAKLNSKNGKILVNYRVAEPEGSELRVANRFRGDDKNIDSDSSSDQQTNKK